MARYSWEPRIRLPYSECCIEDRAAWIAAQFWILRAYVRTAGQATDKPALTWSMLITVQLIFLRGCLASGALDTALMNQDMLFWYEDHRAEIEPAVAAR